MVVLFIPISSMVFNSFLMRVIERVFINNIFTALLIFFLTTLLGCGGSNNLNSDQSKQNPTASINTMKDGSGQFSLFYNSVFRAPLTINPMTNSLLLSTSDFNGGRQLVSWETYQLNELINERSQRSVLMTNFTQDASLINLVSNVYGLKGCLVIYEGKVNAVYGSVTESNSQGDIRDGREYVYTKIDSAKFFDAEGLEISCIGGYGETLGAADFNEDGLIDLVVTSYERNYLFKNNGEYQFVDVTPSFLVKANYVPTVEGLIVADLFKHGRHDIVLNNLVAVHDGGFNFHAIEPSDGFDTPDEGMALSDLDNDGIFEIIRLQPNPPVVRIFKAVAEDNIKLVKTIDIVDSIGIDRNSVFGIGVGDLFSKGCDDIVIPGGRPNGALPLILKNDCKMNFEYVSLGTANGFFNTQILVADIDGDTVPDIMTQGVSYNESSFPLLDGSNAPVQQSSTEGNFIFINQSLKRNNLQLSLMERGDVFHSSGRTIGLSGSNGFKKVYSLNPAAGYLSYGNLRAAGYLDLANCPYTIEVFGFSGQPVQLGCDSVLESAPTSDFKISSLADIKATMNTFNLLGAFTIGSLKSWASGDGGLIANNNQNDNEFRLVNTQSKWGYIRKILNNTCPSSLRLEGDLREGTTFPRLRIGSNSGVWNIVAPVRVSGNFSYDVNQKGAVVIDIYNEDPIANAYSVLMSLKGSCTN